MKLCALICRGKIQELSVVDDGHKFGEHDDHHHSEVTAVKESVCPEGAKQEEAKRV